jgi:hypothetical protein
MSSIEFVFFDVVDHLIELVQEILADPISDLLAVLHLSGLHFPILASGLLEKLPFIGIINKLEVALRVVLDLAF